MEYAEEYTKKEKVIRLSVFILLALSVVAFNNLWLLPLVTDFGEQPHCYELFGLNGADYVWHLLFIGLPVSLFIVVLFMLPRGISGLKEGRFPPKSMKVYKPTVVKRGASAYLKSGAHILFPVITLLFAIWGYHQVDIMPPLNKQKLSLHVCQT
ncbi:hypothetical protein QTV44_004182 [Vibrio vulnificus]|nr:hypothetical protein [Vibrio vulnificus]